MHQPARPGRPSRPGRGPGRWCAPWPCRRRRPPSRRAPRRARASRPPPCAGRRGRGRARRRWPPPGPRRAGAPHRGSTAGTGTLITGAPMSWAMTAASTMASVSRRIRPSLPHQRLDQRLEPGRSRLLEHLAQQLERGRRERVVQVDARHVLDARPAVGRGPADAGHQAVVELEDGAGQAGAVDGEVGAVQRGEVARRGQVVQRLRRGQDAVAGRQRLGQRPEELGPVLGRQHGAGAVVGRQDQRRGGQRRRARSSGAGQRQDDLGHGREVLAPVAGRAGRREQLARRRRGGDRARRRAPRRPWPGRGPWP